MTAPNMILAQDLNATHISETIRFRVWDNNTEVAKVITAELRQVYHNGNETVIHYGVGAGQEQALDHDQPVTRFPPDDYGDVVTLAKYDEFV